MLVLTGMRKEGEGGWGLRKSMQHKHSGLSYLHSYGLEAWGLTWLRHAVKYQSYPLRDVQAQSIGGFRNAGGLGGRPQWLVDAGFLCEIVCSGQGPVCRGCLWADVGRVCSVTGWSAELQML